MSFSHLYLFSDIDGTLGMAGVGIPARNYDAIRRFVRGGGHFGLCTGRWVTDITHFIKGLPVNGISIINNGAALYDTPNKKVISSVALPDQAVDYAREIAALDPRIQVLGANEAGYVLLSGDKSGETASRASRALGCKLPVVRYEELKGPYLKFLFDCPLSCREELIAAARAMGHPGVYYTWSGSTFEMIPEGISKGTGLLEFCRLYSVTLENTIFIGDNYNDREMFMTAGFSACVQGTPRDLRELCRMETGECLNGAVADLIEWIEAHPEAFPKKRLSMTGN